MRIFVRTPNVALAAFALLACGPATPPAPVVSLHYDAALVREGFPTPAARLVVGGRTSWFLFDTGAGAHTLARWFVEAAGLPLDDSLANTVRGVDAAGARVKFDAVRGATGTLADGTELRLDVAVVADFPPMFAELEIGGLINPQLLAGPDRASALDLRVPELRFEAFDEAVARLGAAEVPAEQLRVCGTLEPPVPNLLYAVVASTTSGTGWLGLDSGAGETSLSAGSPLVEGITLEPGGEAMGVAGRGRAYRLARGLTIAFAGQQATVDAEVVDGQGDECGPVGRLGLDAMGGCAFVLGADRLAIVCG